MNNRQYYFGEQQTEEWHALKLGLFSSSDIYKLFSEPKTKKAKEAGEWSKVALKYIEEKGADIIYQEGKEILSGSEIKALDWGNENEPLASKAFSSSMLIFPDKEKLSFVQFGEYTGTSPDDTIDKTIPSEYKCPMNRNIHLDHMDILTGEDLKKYSKQKYYQLMHQMYCLGAEFGYWSSFDRRLLLNKETEHAVIHTIIVQRDEELCEQFAMKIQKAGETRDAFVQRKKKKR
jgi:hypothetical protein